MSDIKNSPDFSQIVTLIEDAKRRVFQRVTKSSSYSISKLVLLYLKRQPMHFGEML